VTPKTNAAPPRSLLRTYLALGRVSNLPTVWTNAVAGAYLSGAAPSARTVVLTAVALSFAYTGGMFLNDAFDREIDARERPERPIPSGAIGAAHVFAVGFGLLAAGSLLVLFVTHTLAPFAWSLALAATIVLYDAWHKTNPLGPLVMAACRALAVIVAASAAGGEITKPVACGAAALLAWVVGLTYVAKKEGAVSLAGAWPAALLVSVVVYSLPAVIRVPGGTIAFFGMIGAVAYALTTLRGTSPGRFPRAVSVLIAGIAFVDAALVARTGAGFVAALVALGFPVTLRLQRWVRGT